MFKIKKAALLSLILSALMICCCACGEKSEKQSESDKTSSGSKESSSSSAGTSSSSGMSNVIGMPNLDSTISPGTESDEADSSEASGSKQENISNYSDVAIKDLLVFDKGLDMYGEKSINILGDSISQGLNAPNLYDDSWASLFKGAVNKKFGSYNMGYVSLNAYDDWGVVTCKEIHTLTIDESKWTRKAAYEAPGTAGNCSYISNPYSPGSTIKFTLNRKEGGTDRHINGFYIYYTAGATYGSFNVKVNGKVVSSVNCFAQKVNGCARSPYIALPAGTGDKLTIEIVTTNSDHKLVSINGISYIDTPGAVTVNNYSLSGVRLVDYDDSLLEKLCKANIVLLTLGTNDAGTQADIETFKHKLSVVSQTCIKNGSLLIVGDVIWPRYGDGMWATPYKNALIDCAKAADGYYIDFSPLDSQYPNLLADNDICHPTVEGHAIIADKICEFFDIKR